MLLKQSVEKDQEIKDTSSEALDSHASMDKAEAQPNEHYKVPKPPASPRTHPKSPRSYRRHTSAEENKAAEVIPEQDRLKEEALKSLLASEFSALPTTRLKESALASRSNSTPNLSSSQNLDSSESVNDSLRGNTAAGSVLPSRPPWLESSKKKDKHGHSSPSRSSSRSKSRPIWLDNDSGIDQGRSSSVTDVQSSSEPHGDEPSLKRRSSTPSAGNKDESWPSEFVSKLVKKCTR